MCVSEYWWSFDQSTTILINFLQCEAELENLSRLSGIYDECAPSRCRKAPSMNLFRALGSSEGGWVTLMTEFMSCRCYAKLTRAHTQADDK